MNLPDLRSNGNTFCTAVALPAESDPVTLAKTIATLDHLSGGRVTVGAGFGWNTAHVDAPACEAARLGEDGAMLLSLEARSRSESL